MIRFFFLIHFFYIDDAFQNFNIEIHYDFSPNLKDMLKSSARKVVSYLVHEVQLPSDIVQIELHNYIEVYINYFICNLCVNRKRERESLI